MSGKARLGANTAKAPVVRREDLDDNISTYRIEEDGRSSEERVHYVRIDRIEASPFQIRRVFPEKDIESLATSIVENGLVHPPKGRPHPTRHGWIELMPGEMRFRALQRLVERGEAESVLKRDGAGNWLAPIVVVQMDDERAEEIVFAENADRTDLSHWEWALAWQQRRDRRRARGLPASLRGLAAAHGVVHSSIQDYPRIADALTLDVFQAAGVVCEDGIDHGRMAPLTYEALKRIAGAAKKGVGAAGQKLLLELSAKGDSSAQRLLQHRKAAGLDGNAAFQINIRQPLGELSPQQAIRYLGRLSSALPVLAERAASEIETEEAAQLASLLERTAQRLRGAR